MIVRVGAAGAEAATITIPTRHIAGDIMIIFAFRDGSTTNPTIPAGWTTITNTTDGTLCSVSMGWKVATSAAETSGTWTNATALLVGVYRNQESLSLVSPFGTISASANTTSPSTYGAVSTMKGETSWLIAFQGHRSTDTTTLTNPPTSMTNVASNLGATCGMAMFDTNGPYNGTNYASNTVAPGGTASGWQTVVLELRPTQMGLQNYQTGFRSRGLSITEKVR